MSAVTRVGFCVSGNGHLFRAAACQAERLGIKPALVIAEARAASDLDEFCAARRIPFHRLDAGDRSAFDQQVDRLCIEAKLDLLALTFDRILSPELVAHYRGRIINVHVGLLPAFKGMNALEQATNAGVRFAGATIHEVTDDLDGGAVIAQCLIGVRRQESADSLGRRLFGSLRLMFLQVLAWYAAGRVETDAQGRVWVKGAVYGELPISPAIEDGFPEDCR